MKVAEVLVKSFDALCIGETMVMVTPVAASRLDANSQYLLKPGGAESNVATHFASLGNSAAWASQLGQDPLGQLIIDDLERHGVDTSLVVRLAGFPTAVYFKDPSPEGTTVYYYRAGSAASKMTPESARAWRDVSTRLVHLSGITAALSDGCRDLIEHLIFDRPIAAPISFDVNYRAQLFTAETADTLLALAQASDIVFVGRDEAELLWHTSTADQIRALLSKPATVVVKDGSNEAVEYTRQAVCRIPAPTIKVVESVGAGDAFAAGWLNGYLAGRDAETKLKLGHYAASRVLSSPTDDAPLGGRAEIEEILEKPTSDW